MSPVGFDVAGRESVKSAPHDTAPMAHDDRMKFRRGAIPAVEKFRRAGPWRGALEERKRKFRRLNGALAGAYGMPVLELRFAGINGGFSGASSCLRRGDGRPASITMRGKPSIEGTQEALLQRDRLPRRAARYGSWEKPGMKRCTCTFFTNTKLGFRHGERRTRTLAISTARESRTGVVPSIG